MTDSIWQVIGRLRRAQPRNPDTMALCDAYEAASAAIHRLEDIMVSEHAARKEAENTVAGLFDRKVYMREYMREYMRRRRAKAKEAR